MRHPLTETDDNALLQLRDFDSIPVTAGLTNLQTFRLSLRHALTVLPVLSEARAALQRMGENPVRFSL